MKAGVVRLRTLWSRLLALGRRRRLDRDLHDQIASHLEEAAEEYERQGLSPEEARRAARRSFGGVLQAQEAHHDARSFAWIDDARRDMRYALRSMRLMPGFSAIVILTLALATGTATALFSVIDAALLRPVPYPNPDEIVSVNVGESVDERRAPSAADVELWRASTTVFSRLGMGRMTGGLRLSVVDAGTPEQLNIGTASEDLLEVFGISPVLGRAFTIDDRRPGAPTVVLLSHRYWRTRFGGARDVLDRSIVIDGTRAAIIGVLPPDFFVETMLWRPHVVPAAMQTSRGSGTPVYGRLRSGVDLEAATQELTRRMPDADRTNPALRAQLVTLYDEETDGYGRTIAVLSGAVVLILLIACVNVAGLLLARGTTREPEFAIRTSMGAGRGRLIRQLFAESAVLAAIGGLCGVAFAWTALDAIVGLIPLQLPVNVPASINGQVLAFALALSMVTALVFGLAPAITSSGVHARTFRAAGRARYGSTLSRRGGQILIAVELAMAFVLVTGAALMIRTFSNLVAVDVGFEPGASYTMEVVPVERDAAALRAYFTTLMQNVRQIPGLAAAGAVDRPLLDGSGSYTSASANGKSTPVRQRRVMPGFVEAIGLPLRLGRFPTDADYTTNPPFAVLSESAARAIFPDQSPIGRAFTLNRTAWVVVGVVADARSDGPMPGDREEPPELYLALRPNAQSPFGAGLSLVVRPAGRMPQLAGQLRRAAAEIGPPVFVGPLRNGRAWFNERIEEPLQQTLMLGALGGVGLLLTLVGISATTAYAVARRTREIGIRMALGARAGQIVGSMVRDAASPVAAGLILGFAGAIAATRVIESFLFETTPTEPSVFSAAAIAVALTALAAAWIPARRAARIDPVTSLRSE